jgi:hypothetical protein
MSIAGCGKPYLEAFDVMLANDRDQRVGVGEVGENPGAPEAPIHDAQRILQHLLIRG